MKRGPGVRALPRENVLRRQRVNFFTGELFSRKSPVLFDFFYIIFAG